MASQRKPSAPEPEPVEKSEAELSFEEALDRLESIVEDLESGSLTLEESIARYESGVRLSRRLTQTLDEAEKRIERLVEQGEGKPPATRPMDPEDRSEPPAAEPGAEERTRAPAGPRSAPRGPGEGRSGPGPEELPF